MASKDQRFEAKRVAVVERLKDAHSNLDILSGMWNERTLDALILAFGIGEVVLATKQPEDA